MKVTLSVEREFDLKTLHVDAGVRYWEDATVNGVEDESGDLIPCRNDDRWQPIIDLETGVITNWKQGVKAEIHYKVCDDGLYSLFDANGEKIITKDCYVPDCLSPKENGYGDYIIMDIDENGKIDKWKPDIDDLIDD